MCKYAECKLYLFVIFVSQICESTVVKSNHTIILTIHEFVHEAVQLAALCPALLSLGFILIE